MVEEEENLRRELNFLAPAVSGVLSVVSRQSSSATEKLETRNRNVII